jgi:hypothetical protein
MRILNPTYAKFYSEYIMGRNHLVDLGVDGGITLKYI